MYSLVNLIIALIIGGAIGSLIGWYSALASRGDNKRKIILELESQLDQARQNKVDYEAEVTEHFSRTADLLNKLTDDYRSVYTHLANGADQLCGDQISMSEPALSAPPMTQQRNLTSSRWLSLWTMRPKSQMSRVNYPKHSDSKSRTVQLLESLKRDSGCR